VSRDDLSTPQGVLRFCEMRRAEMVRCFERIGRFEANGYAFCAYVFATHEAKAPAELTPEAWKPGPKLARVEPTLCQLPDWVMDQFPPEVHTQILGKTLGFFAKVTRALGVVLMTEMWMVSLPNKEDRAALPESLEHAPGRREGLMMSLEHSATGRKMWFAEIKRNPTRLEPWEERTPEDAEGRLLNLAEWRS
jgi:hypothetical protein